jgi:hypothetical protein
VSCDFNDGTGIIFMPLSLVTGHRFDTIIRLHRKPPQHADLFTGAVIVEMG